MYVTVVPCCQYSNLQVYQNILVRMLSHMISDLPPSVSPSPTLPPPFIKHQAFTQPDNIQSAHRHNPKYFVIIILNNPSTQKPKAKSPKSQSTDTNPNPNPLKIPPSLPCSPLPTDYELQATTLSTRPELLTTY